MLTPLVTYVAPYQTVCNYWNYYWTPLGEHVSEPVPGGTGQRSSLKSDNRTQDNRVSDSSADRPVDVPVGQDPQEAKAPNGDPLQALHAGAYRNAIDAQGNADCTVGQYGYMNGPLPGGRYPASTDPEKGGGSHVVIDNGLPGLSGPDLQGARARHQEPEGREVAVRFSDIPRGGAQRRGMSAFKAGALAAILIALFAFFGFTKSNPFANKYELNAVFHDANRPGQPLARADRGRGRGQGRGRGAAGERFGLWCG